MLCFLCQFQALGFDQKKIIQDEVCKLANIDYQLTFYQDLANLDRGFILRKKD